MLDPRIMQVAIEPQAFVQGQESYLSVERTDTLKGLLTNVGFTQTQPPVVVQPSNPSGGRVARRRCSICRQRWTLLSRAR